MNNFIKIILLLVVSSAPYQAYSMDAALINSCRNGHSDEVQRICNNIPQLTTELAQATLRVTLDDCSGSKASTEILKILLPKTNIKDIPTALTTFWTMKAAVHASACGDTEVMEILLQEDINPTYAIDVCTDAATCPPPYAFEHVHKVLEILKMYQQKQ